MRVQDGVCLLQEGRVQFVRARLDRLCSRQDLDFKGVQRACTVIQFERINNEIRIFCECRTESVDSPRVPAGSVQCKVYPERPVFTGVRKDSHQFSSRHRSSGGFVRRIERSAGVIDDSVTGVTPSWGRVGSCPPRGRERVMTMQCLKYPQVQGLCFSSGGLFVNPKKRSNSRGSGRRKRGSSRPCRGP